MRISDWSSDVCSSDLRRSSEAIVAHAGDSRSTREFPALLSRNQAEGPVVISDAAFRNYFKIQRALPVSHRFDVRRSRSSARSAGTCPCLPAPRSEEHTSELQSLMRNSYAVSCLKTNTV